MLGEVITWVQLNALLAVMQAEEPAKALAQGLA